MKLGNEGDTVKVYCNQCKLDINQKIIANVDSKNSYLDSREIQYNGKVKEYYVHFEESYQIIQCLGCNAKSFRKMKWCSEWQDFEDPGIEEKQFPVSEKNYRLENKYIDLPLIIKDIYSQTIVAYNKRLLILSAAGIRAILEGVCKQQKINENKKKYIDKNGNEKMRNLKSLYEKIEMLFELKIISEQQKISLHELRYLGNKAIHELDNPNKEDLEMGIDIIENMLSNIYEIPVKAKLLAEKRIIKEKSV